MAFFAERCLKEDRTLSTLHDDSDFKPFRVLESKRSHPPVSIHITLEFHTRVSHGGGAVLAPGRMGLQNVSPERVYDGQERTFKYFQYRDPTHDVTGDGEVT